MKHHSHRLAWFLSAVLVAALAWPGGVRAEPPVVGQSAPDFEVADLQGKPVQLSKLEAAGPVVLVVLRGFPGYQCPICTRQFGEYLSAADQIKNTGAQVVFVYPGAAEGLKAHADEFVAGKDYPAFFHFTLDPDYAFLKAYDLRWDAPKETSYPSTFVIDAHGKVVYAKISKTHGDRAPVAEVIKALEKK